jgi:hypothetical protein
VDGGQGFAVIDETYVWKHFDELLEGTWLIGWYGGQNHVSWIRFASGAASPAGGDIAVLATDPSVPSNVAYWPCSGLGGWAPTQRLSTVDLLPMPQGCSREILTFNTFRPVSWPGTAFLEAEILTTRIQDGGAESSTQIVGLKYPDDICNSSFTSCGPAF